MKFITIYNTIHANEVSIISNILEENNIDFHTPDEATNSAAGIGGLGMAGMRVMVPENQIEEALAVLKDRGFAVNSGQ
ncbi:DUF2007 domain-containing protein [Salinimicrobium sp. GXAS 041]|uniref:putative signal transducing protein n=1 Tax=Salinimicrobium sp. GXAS 041 TaxID=3400806 RepID=UPI003C74E953